MGGVITTQAAASVGQFVPAREPGSSKGLGRWKTAQAVASAGQFVSAWKHGSSKGSSKGTRRAKIVQAASTAVRVVRARSPRVE